MLMTRAPKSRIGASTLVAIALAIMFLGATLPTPLYPLYRHRFGFSEVTLTLVYSVYVLGNLGALFFFARLSDQIGRKATAWPAIGIGMASTAAFGLASGTAWLFAARALSGFSTGLASGTLTAWIAELQPEGRSGAGAVTATVANFSGLAIGPLIGSLPAQFELQPLRLPFVVYIVVLAAAGTALSFVPETVDKRARRFAELSLRPRLGVPRERLAAFVSPAVTAFVTFALIGFYAALIPGVLAEALKDSRPLVSGAVLFLLFTVADRDVLRQLVTRDRHRLAVHPHRPGVRASNLRRPDRVACGDRPGGRLEICTQKRELTGAGNGRESNARKSPR